jgi:hypothetical protein
LGTQQRGDELAEDDGLAVGDEVGFTAAAFERRQQQSFDEVVDVNDVHELLAATDPPQSTRPRPFGYRRQKFVVAGAPDIPRPDDHSRKSVVVGIPHRQLGHRLRCGIRHSRVRPQRCGFVDRAQRPAGSNRRYCATVDKPLDTSGSRCGHDILGAGDVVAHEIVPATPVAGIGSQMIGGIAIPCAGDDRIHVGEIPTDCLGSAGLHR